MSDSPQQTRIPIPIKLLLFSREKMPVDLPRGMTSEGREQAPFVKAGMSGEIMTRIDYRPWMRQYVVVRTKRIMRTDKGNEVATFQPAGEPFTVPESWCIAVPAEEL